MNRGYHNIEYKPFAGKDYRIGYGGGRVWRIVKIIDTRFNRVSRPCWKATCTHGTSGKVVVGVTVTMRTLEQISNKLASFD